MNGDPFTLVEYPLYSNPFSVECPACGASPDQLCSHLFPGVPTRTEFSSLVHQARLE